MSVEKQKAFRLAEEEVQDINDLIARSPFKDAEWFRDVLTKAKLYEKATENPTLQPDIVEMAMLLKRQADVFNNFLEKGLDVLDVQKAHMGKELSEKEAEIHVLENRIQGLIQEVDRYKKDSASHMNQLNEAKQKYKELADSNATQTKLMEEYQRQLGRTAENEKEYRLLREKHAQLEDKLQRTEKDFVDYKTLSSSVLEDKNNELIMMTKNIDTLRSENTGLNATIVHLNKSQEQEINIINLKHEKRILELQNENEKAIQYNQLRVGLSVAEKAVDHSFNPKELIEQITGARVEELLNRSEGETKERLSKIVSGAE